MDWLLPWWCVTERPELVAAYETELRGELGAGHPLFRVPVEAVGKHDATDDVLFRLSDGSGRVAVVHLTWARHPEPFPWPETEIYLDLRDFAERRMKPDHEERRA